MRILFLISIAAVVVLMWAAFSSARHVRRARRKQARHEEINNVSSGTRLDPAAPPVSKPAAKQSAEHKISGSLPSSERTSSSAPGGPRDWAELRNGSRSGMGRFSVQATDAIAERSRTF